MPGEAADFDDLVFGPLPTDEELVQSSLLQRQYLPNVKTGGEELPPIFSSASMSVACAEALCVVTDRSTYETRWVELRTRRYDGLHRRLGIPHPVTYSRLVLHVASNWGNLEPFLDGSSSQIRPAFHSDGRLIRMDYEIASEVMNRDARNAQGMRFRVDADVSSCFPSIYSHSLDWALRGITTAKQDRSANSWQAGLDARVRRMHNGETKGVTIGPAISNILAEVVLQRVDAELSAKYSFLRYVDDYTAYCRERSDAESFIVDLQRALGRFRLDLNTRKTQVVDLRAGMGDGWVYDALSRLPERWSPLSAARYLRYCETLALRYPHASVLKFGVKALLARRQDAGATPTILVIDELVRLCDFNPHLAPFLHSELEEGVPYLEASEMSRIHEAVTERMVEAADRAETDVVLWYLRAITEVLKGGVDSSTANSLRSMDDDLVSVALAVLCPGERAGVVAQAIGRDYPSESDRQSHWLSRYELRRVGLVPDDKISESERVWMQILIDHGVRFSELS